MSIVGTIKYISPDDGGDDIFLHFSAVVDDMSVTLRAGQRVRFDIFQGPDGIKKATNCSAIQ